ALYVHYTSKTRLLEEIIKLGHQSALKAFQEGFDQTSDPAERITRAVHNFTAWHAQNQMLARVVQYELEALPSRERREISALRTNFEGMLRGEIERGIADKTFESSDVSGTATAIFSLCIDVARWYSPRRGRTPNAIGRLYGELAIRMLRAPQ
ncbi:MAG: TetR family transcriptional regulator, partial [Chloroflexota bacterium]|nr:TetR family transcriptional regulator [Chloroflexota bacterium]